MLVNRANVDDGKGHAGDGQRCVNNNVRWSIMARCMLMTARHVPMMAESFIDSQVHATDDRGQADDGQRHADGGLWHVHCCLQLATDCWRHLHNS